MQRKRGASTIKHFLQLRRLAEDQGFETQEDLAAASGIHPRTINKRLNRQGGKSSWSPNEIVAICNVLHIPQEQIGYYFFPDVEPEGKKE